MKSMVDLSHEFIRPVLHKQAICVDATLGQGKDTDFFLSQNVHKVYGFEIQRDVFESTKERLDAQSKPLPNNPIFREKLPPTHQNAP